MGASTNSAEFQAWLTERNRALVNLDEMHIAKTMPQVPPEMRLCVLHKARYEATGIPAIYRNESGQWLLERGYGRLTGTPLLPKGELPE